MTIAIPDAEVLKKTPFYFGKAKVHFLPKQYALTFAPEPEIGFKSGFGAGKTAGGIYRATRLSTWYPGNRGLIGRYASTDLAATTRRDCLEFWEKARVLAEFKEKGEFKIPTAMLRCVDPKTQEILPKKFSEVQFVHLDNPTHIHGFKVGWAWIDEDSECSLDIYNKLMSRIRLPGFEKHYSLFTTGNPEGHDWSYMHFHDMETRMGLSADVRKKRLAITATTRENYFLPPEYIQNMYDSYSPNMRKKYLDCSFDVFDGQIYEEFRTDLHVIRRFEPPVNWNRLLAIDVGGSDPWAWIFAAVDPFGNVVVYDEIYGPGVRIDPFAAKALPRLDPKFHFQSKVIDFENKLAAGELAERGIVVTNAKKANKNDSIFRLSGYLHPNDSHVYPKWHPQAGQSGAPRMFIMDHCKNLLNELPQQRWRKIRGKDTMENEPDPNVHNHAVDALLYICRELPRPTVLANGESDEPKADLSPMSKIMHFERRQREEQKKRDLWNIHMGYGRRKRPRVQWEVA